MGKNAIPNQIKWQQWNNNVLNSGYILYVLQLTDVACYFCGMYRVNASDGKLQLKTWKKLHPPDF